MKNIAPAVIGAILFGLVGVVCAMQPIWVRDVALRYYDRHPNVARFNPFLMWMKSRSYVWSIRAGGGLGIVMSLIIIRIILQSRGE